MKKNPTLFIVLVLSIFTFACSEPIDIDIEDQDRVLVVNSVINPDSLIKVNLARSLSVKESDSSFKFIENATVEIYENGTLIDELSHSKNGYYISSHKPKENTTYKLIAKAANFEPAQSEIKIGMPVPIKSLTADIEVESYTETWWDEETQTEFDTTIYYIVSERSFINVSFDDNPNEENYYFLALYTYQDVYEYLPPNYEEVYMGEKLQPIDYNNASLSYENYYYSNGLVGYAISDDFFNGQTYSSNLDLYLWSVPKKPYIYVQLLSINKEFFDFVTSYNKYEESTYNPFAEPVNVRSNIENGFGIFTGYSTSKDSVKIW